MFLGYHNRPRIDLQCHLWINIHIWIIYYSEPTLICLVAMGNGNDNTIDRLNPGINNHSKQTNRKHHWVIKYLYKTNKTLNILQKRLKVAAEFRVFKMESNQNTKGPHQGFTQINVGGKIIERDQSETLVRWKLNQ